MRAVFALAIVLSLAVPTAAGLAANDAEAPPGRLLAQGPPPGGPPPGQVQPGRPSPKANALLMCNQQQAACTQRCNAMTFGDQRNRCYNGCNAAFVACTNRANAMR